MSTDEKILKAVEEFGPNTVQEVKLLVDMADPDGAYTQFEDMYMFEHADCVAFLYFEEE